MRPVRKYLRKVNFEIFRYWVAKTMPFSVIRFDLSPFSQISAGFTARVMPKDGRWMRFVAKVLKLNG